MGAFDLGKLRRLSRKQILRCSVFEIRCSVFKTSMFDIKNIATTLQDSLLKKSSYPITYPLVR